MSLLMQHYFDKLGEIMQKIRTTQEEAILRTARLAADSIANGGVLHVFGSGHSHMIAEDVFHRAGGLSCINAMLEPSLMELNVGRATMLERLPGYAEVLLSGYDLRPGEVIVVVSNSGINAVPIEVAMACKARGMHVAALTNLNHSSREASRHPSGKKLYEVADITLDHCGEYGDAILPLGEGEPPIGPTSTWAGILIIQAIVVSIVEELRNRNVEPPVLISANRAGGDGHNRELLDRCRSRIRYL